MHKLSDKTTSTFLFLLISMGLVQPLCAETNDTLRTNVLRDVEIVPSVKEQGNQRTQPSAVSLLDARQLEARKVTSLKGISGQVPNLYIPDYGSRLTSAVYIRGVGSRINTPATGLYVDDIPFADKSAFDFRFFDVDRIDVLRGPQGTLYGRNAMGGIVRVYTRNPFSYQGTDLQAGYASGDNHRNFSVAHYHRPNERMAFSAGGYYESGDGFFRNSFTGNKADGMQAAGGRMRGIFKAKEQLTIDLSAQYEFSNEDAYPYYYSGSVSGEESYEDAIGRITANRQSTYRRSLFTTGANITYTNPKFVLNAITGYQHLRDRMFMDQDFLSPDIYTLEQRQRIHTLNEEILMKSPEGNRRWQWVNGINLMAQALYTQAPVHFYEDGMQWLTNNINSYLPDLSGYGMSMNVNFTDDELAMDGRFHTPAVNIAAFHQSTLQLTRGLSAVVGLRLDCDHLRMKYDAPASTNFAFSMNRGNIPLVTLPDLQASYVYNGTLKNNYLRLLPKVALKYDFDDTNSLYASAAMGQRSGGYNLQMFSDLLQGALRSAMMDELRDKAGERAAMMPTFETPTIDQVRYKPEYSWNYEVGAHLSNNDHRLSADVSLFLMQTRNQQIARFADSGLGRMMVNAGRSRSMGAEFTGRWRATDALLWVVNYGYTHATFTDYVDGTTTTDADGNKVETDYTGNYVPFVPQHNVNVDGSYTWQLRPRWARTLTLGVNYAGTGRIYWTESNRTGDDAKVACQSYYSLLSARVAWALNKVTVTLWGRNLTQTHYNTFYFESASRGYEQHGKPLQIGVDVKLHL